MFNYFLFQFLLEYLQAQMIGPFKEDRKAKDGKKMRNEKKRRKYFNDGKWYTNIKQYVNKILCKEWNSLRFSH